MTSQDKQSGVNPGKSDDVMASGTSDKGDGAKGKNLAPIEVAIPIRQSSPFEGSSSSGTQSRSGVETPATTVTPAESDTTLNRPRKRVNATERARELRNSSFSLSSASRNQKRGIDEISEPGLPESLSTETSDARLARALQAEEYEKTNVKRAKQSELNKTSGIHNSTDDENDDLLLGVNWAAFDKAATTSRYRTGDNIVADSVGSSLSELDSESTELNDAAAESEDNEMTEEDLYEESAAYDETSEEDTDEGGVPPPMAGLVPVPMPIPGLMPASVPAPAPVPVMNTRRRATVRPRRRARPTRRRRESSSSSDMSPARSRLSRRVRPHSSFFSRYRTNRITGTNRAKEIRAAAPVRQVYVD